jgi:hypothetical protein
VLFCSLDPALKRRAKFNPPLRGATAMLTDCDERRRLLR